VKTLETTLSGGWRRRLSAQTTALTLVLDKEALGYWRKQRVPILWWRFEGLVDGMVKIEVVRRRPDGSWKERAILRLTNQSQGNSLYLLLP
jgi:hypothetical protein